MNLVKTVSVTVALYFAFSSKSSQLQSHFTSLSATNRLSYSRTLLRFQQQEGCVPEIGRTLNEETSEFIRLELDFIWCLNADTS